MGTGITELAKLLKDRENKNDYSPMFGQIIELPNLKIRVGSKIILTRQHIRKSCVYYKERDRYGRFIHLNREVVLLPYAEGQKFVLVGVVYR